MSNRNGFPGGGLRTDVWVSCNWCVGKESRKTSRHHRFARTGETDEHKRLGGRGAGLEVRRGCRGGCWCSSLRILVRDKVLGDPETKGQTWDWPMFLILSMSVHTYFRQVFPKARKFRKTKISTTLPVYKSPPTSTILESRGHQRSCITLRKSILLLGRLGGGKDFHLNTTSLFKSKHFGFCLSYEWRTDKDRK